MLQTIYIGVVQVKEIKVHTLKSDSKTFLMEDNELVDGFAMKLMMIITGINSLCDKMGEISIIKKFF